MRKQLEVRLVPAKPEEIHVPGVDMDARRVLIPGTASSLLVINLHTGTLGERPMNEYMKRIHEQITREFRDEENLHILVIPTREGTPSATIEVYGIEEG